MIGLLTEQSDICGGQVIGNTWKENIFVLVILKPIDDSSNANKIIHLGDILYRNLDLDIIKMSAL
jgi:hypothetical protein